MTRAPVVHEARNLAHTFSSGSVKGRIVRNYELHALTTSRPVARWRHSRKIRYSFSLSSCFR